MSDFPNALDNLAADKVNSTVALNDHPGQHNAVAEAVNAVQDYLLNGRGDGSVLINADGSVSITPAAGAGTVLTHGDVADAAKVLHITATVANGHGITSTYRPFHLESWITETESPLRLLWTGMHSSVRVGHGGAATKGSVHAGTFEATVVGVGDELAEHAGLFHSLRYDIGTGYTQTAGPSGRAWGTDFNVHGPIAVQPHLLAGTVQFVNNYYDGSPVSGSYGAAIITKRGSGGSKDAAHEAAETFPVDVGLAILGASGTSGDPTSRQGFTRGLLIGDLAGLKGPWNVPDTRVGTAVELNNYETIGLHLSGRWSGSSARAVVVADGAGAVIIGADTVLSSSSRLDVRAVEHTNPLALFGSAGNFFHTVRLRNGVGQISWFIADQANRFLTGTIAGDGGWFPNDEGKSLHLGGTASVIQVNRANELGFFATTPAAQQVLATGAGASVDDVITVLQTYGLVSQS